MKPTLIKIRGYHLDFYQHVNNARYLEFIEEARWAAFEESHLIEQLTQHGLGFIVVNINIRYRQSAKLGDVLEVRNTHGEFNRRSAVLKQTIYFAGSDKISAEAEVTYVLLDLDKNRAVEITDNLRALLLQENRQ